MIAHIIPLKIIVLLNFDKHFLLQYFTMAAIQNLLLQSLFVAKHFVVEQNHFIIPFVLFYF
jgi:hypothetical protein